MTSNHHAPYGRGYTRATMAETEGGSPVRVSEPQKYRLSSDCSLQPDYMKPESLVIAIRMLGEYVPGSCTHRPSHHGSRKCPKSVAQPKRRELPKVELVTGVKS